jgi:hypothetical protein
MSIVIAGALAKQGPTGCGNMNLVIDIIKCLYYDKNRNVYASLWERSHFGKAVIGTKLIFTDPPILQLAWVEMSEK